MTTAKSDAACGTAVPAAKDWCNLNAAMPTKNSNVYCEVFDTGQPLDGNYGYSEGVRRTSWVGHDYVSPYCALTTLLGDGGSGYGAYSFHAYTVAPGAGTLSSSADILVPNTPACNGATISRIWVSPSDQSSNAGMAWITVTNLQGSGAAPSGYTLQVYAQGGTRPDGGSGGGNVSNPQLVDVRPNVDGWARISLELSTYTLSSTSVTLTAIASVNAAGDTKAAGLLSSPKVTATGGFQSGLPDTPGAETDVGIIPNPTTGVPTFGCDVLIDDVVSNLVASP